MADSIAPFYIIEVNVPHSIYKILTDKSEEFSTKKDFISAEALAEVLLKKASLELELLSSNKSFKDLTKELDNLGIYKELYKREFETKPEGISSKDVNTILSYDRLLKIGIGTFNNAEKNFNLLKKIFNFNYNEEILLKVISSIKASDYAEEEVPKCLIVFEDYVKGNVN